MRRTKLRGRTVAEKDMQRNVADRHEELNWRRWSATLQIPLIVALTMLVSIVLYHRFELPLMQIGKRLARPTSVPAHVF